jgi:hypothetical protein
LDRFLAWPVLWPHFDPQYSRWGNFDRWDCQKSHASATWLTSIAALSLFVHLCGASLWRLVKYLAHQKKATYGDKQNGLTQAQRVVLRNNNSPTSAALQYLQLGHAWRKSVPHSIWRSLTMSVLAIAIASASAVFGILSSKVTFANHSTGLKSSSSCGFWTADTFLHTAKDLLAGNLNDAKYADACYGATSPVQCSTLYVRPSLNWTLLTNSSCPFAESVCLGGPAQAIGMVSDLIETRDDLGLNTPDDERLFYRRTTTCAVIDDLDHLTEFNITYEDDVTSSNQGLTLGFVPQYNNSIFRDYIYWYDEHNAVTQTEYVLA